MRNRECAPDRFRSAVPERSNQSETCNGYKEQNQADQLAAAEVHASGHPIPPAVGCFVFHLRPVPDGDGRHTGQDAPDDGVPEPGIAGCPAQGRGRHRKQIREHGQIVGEDTGLFRR